MQTSSPAFPHSTELAADFKRTVPFLRIDTLQRLIDIVLAMITAQNVNHLKLSPHMPGNSSVEAKKRRVERGVGDQQLTMKVFLALILTRIPPGKWLLSLDRTNWDYGASPMNLLVLGVVIEGYTIPLIWDALEHTGNSDTHTRMWLVSQLLRVFPASRWRGLVADREFIGAEWFRFLRKSGIKRAVRVKKNTRLDGLRASEWFDDIAPGQYRCLAEKAPVFGEVMQVVATRSPAGDLVLIATDFNVWDTVVLYRMRWSVECTFSSLKSRGFDLERTGMSDPPALERLFGFVVLAWLSCLQVGVWRSGHKPIKTLKHGRKAISLPAYGAQYLIHALRWGHDSLPALLILLTQPISPLGQQKSGVVGY